MLVLSLIICIKAISVRTASYSFDTRILVRGRICILQHICEDILGIKEYGV